MDRDPQQRAGKDAPDQSDQLQNLRDLRQFLKETAAVELFDGWARQRFGKAISAAATKSKSKKR